MEPGDLVRIIDVDGTVYEGAVLFTIPANQLTDVPTEFHFLVDGEIKIYRKPWYSFIKIENENNNK